MIIHTILVYRKLPIFYSMLYITIETSNIKENNSNFHQNLLIYNAIDRYKVKSKHLLDCFFTLNFIEHIHKQNIYINVMMMLLLN